MPDKPLPDLLFASSVEASTASIRCVVRTTSSAKGQLPSSEKPKEVGRAEDKGKESEVEKRQCRECS